MLLPSSDIHARRERKCKWKPNSYPLLLYCEPIRGMYGRTRWYRYTRCNMSLNNRSENLKFKLFRSSKSFFLGKFDFIWLSCSKAFKPDILHRACFTFFRCSHHQAGTKEKVQWIPGGVLCDDIAIQYTDVMNFSMTATYIIDPKTQNVSFI